MLTLPTSHALQIDEFTHPKTGRVSRCYRFNYRSMDRCVLSLTFLSLSTTSCRS